jgi:hypothetical protein
MRAHIITKTSWLRRNAGSRAIVLSIAICSLAIPAIASADSDYSSINAITGGSGESSESVGRLPAPDAYLAQRGIGGSHVSVSPVDGTDGSARVDSDYASLNAITARTATELGQAAGEPGDGGGAPGSDPRYSSLNAITGAPAGEPTLVSVSPAGSADEFQWGDAALGAGAMLALTALGGAAFLTVRRRTSLSPSTSTS